MEPLSLENVLEPCAYAPTYVLKDFPIARYQGLQFVSTQRERLPKATVSPNLTPKLLALPVGVPVLHLSQRPHPPHSHGDRQQVLLPRVPTLPGKVGWRWGIILSEARRRSLREEGH